MMPYIENGVIKKPVYTINADLSIRHKTENVYCHLKEIAIKKILYDGYLPECFHYVLEMTNCGFQLIAWPISFSAFWLRECEDD